VLVGWMGRDNGHGDIPVGAGEVIRFEGQTATCHISAGMPLEK
jgi:hypothetical protein